MQVGYFGPIDFLSALLWALIILVVAQSRYSRNKDTPHYKYYVWNVVFKLFFGLAFACVYVLYFGGGDTTAYWDGAITLNNLFFESPSLYFQEMLGNGGIDGNFNRFSAATGYPPGWIYREPEGWFVSKTASLISFITFKSYWAGTFIVGFILANATWRLYDFVVGMGLHKPWHAALAILFIPSVSFWCATISKDAMVLIAVIYTIINLFKIISLEHKSTIWNWLGVLFFLYVILQTRSAVAMAVVAPVLFAVVARVRKRYKDNPFVGAFLSNGLLLIGIALFLVFISTQGEVLQGYIEEASVVQQDFTNNQTYGQNKYDIGITDYTPLGLLKSFPAAILAGTFRPFIWEALSPTLLVNGLESLVFMYLTFLFFFSGSLPKKIHMIRRNEFLMFAFYFVLLMAFMAGFTGVLFGVLVRFKAAVLPFLVLLLTANDNSKLTIDN
jgi:hypothetical protein